MSDFALFLILFPVIFGALAALKISSDRKYGTQAERAAEMNGYTASQPEPTRRPRTHESAPARVIAPARPPAIQAAPVVSAGQPGPLSGNEVWHKLQTAIHLMIVGPTNAGKSTTARAVLWGRVEAGDQVLILDPHAAPDEWSGVPAVGHGRDYPAIERAMLALLTEMTDRYAQRATRPGYAAPPLTIFIDEWPSIQTHCKATAAAFMAALAQEGRKVAMRLVILTQSNRVESLGIAGKGDIRDNFTTLLLAEKALELCPASAALDRPAAIHHNGAIVPAYAGFAPAVAARPMPYVVLWGVPPGELASGAHDASIPDGIDPDLYRRLMGNEDLLEPLHTSDGMAGNTKNGQKSAVSPVMETAVLRDDTSKKPVIDNLPTDEQSVAIRLLVNGGMSRNKTIALLSLPGTRTDQLKRIKAALGEGEA